MNKIRFLLLLLSISLLIAFPLMASGDKEEETGDKIVLILADNQADLSTGAGLLLAMGIEEFHAKGYNLIPAS